MLRPESGSIGAGMRMHGGRAVDERDAAGADAGPALPQVRKPALVRRIGAVDVAELRAHAGRLSERVWRQEDARKENAFPCFAHTRHVVFRFIPGNRTPLQYYSTPLWAIWERLLLSVMTQAAAPYGYARPMYPKAMLARLAAGSGIGVHVDHVPDRTGAFSQESHAFTHKIHVPIETDPRAVLTVGGVDFHLEAGYAWEVNNLVAHGAFNGSARDRVHFIFELFDGSLAGDAVDAENRWTSRKVAAT